MENVFKACVLKGTDSIAKTSGKNYTVGDTFEILGESELAPGASTDWVTEQFQVQ